MVNAGDFIVLILIGFFLFLWRLPCRYTDDGQENVTRSVTIFLPIGQELFIPCRRFLSGRVLSSACLQSPIVLGVGFGVGWVILANDVAQISNKTVHRYNLIARPEDKIW